LNSSPNKPGEALHARMCALESQYSDCELKHAKTAYSKKFVSSKIIHGIAEGFHGIAEKLFNSEKLITQQFFFELTNLFYQLYTVCIAMHLKFLFICQICQHHKVFPKTARYLGFLLYLLWAMCKFKRPRYTPSSDFEASHRFFQ
jgi:hypothetical protein